MNKYIGVKIVDAKEMYRHEAIKKGYCRLAPDEDIHNQPNDYGYHVIYEDGYESWSPAKVFEAAYKLIDDLRETAILMFSNDYKERFIAEYKQISIHYKNIQVLCSLWDNGKLDSAPICPRELYDDQLLAMKQYLDILKKRAEIEKINLD